MYAGAHAAAAAEQSSEGHQSFSQRADMASGGVTGNPRRESPPKKERTSNSILEERSNPRSLGKTVVE